MGPTAEPLDAVLASLERAEMVVPNAASRFPAEREMAFRHALVREAAYATLTEDDRTQAHREAGVWLEGAGEGDRVVLAEHAERAGERQRAAELYERAARASFRRADLSGAVARAERGVRCAPNDEVLGALRAVQADASFWGGHPEEALVHAADAVRASPHGSAAWCRGVAMKVIAAHPLGDARALEEGLSIFRGPLDVSPANARSLFAAVPTMYLFGDVELAQRWGAIIEPQLARLARDDLSAYAFLEWLRGYRGRCAGDMWGGCRHLQRAGQAYADLQNWHLAGQLKLEEGINLFHCGNFRDAEACGSAAYDLYDRHGIRLYLDVLRSLVLGARVLAGGGGDPRQAFLAMIERARARPTRNTLTEDLARFFLLELLRHARDWESLAREAARATGDGWAGSRIHARVQLSVALGELGRHDEGREAAMDALRLAGPGAGLWGYGIHARLAAGEALRAAGDTEAGARLLGEARSTLLALASRIDDPAARHAYLHNVWAHARLVDLTGGRPASLP
jgi:tetratricopeptide (TPR) repeat protein